MKRKILGKILFSLLALVITVAFLYAATFLNFEIGGAIGVTLIAQILIGTIGVFWIFAMVPDPTRQTTYFVLGVVKVIAALYSLALGQIKGIPEISLFSGLNIFEALIIMFSGFFFMMYGWMIQTLIGRTS